MKKLILTCTACGHGHEYEHEYISNRIQKNVKKQFFLLCTECKKINYIVERPDGTIAPRLPVYKKTKETIANAQENKNRGIRGFVGCMVTGNGFKFTF